MGGVHGSGRNLGEEGREGKVGGGRRDGEGEFGVHRLQVVHFIVDRMMGGRGWGTPVRGRGREGGREREAKGGRSDDKSTVR